MNAIKTPTVSIVLPTHNRSQLLEEAIQSVCEQKLQDYELIVVDDASDIKVDENHLKTNFKISRLIVKRNSVSKGGAESKNIGVSLAKGKYLAFLDDDDKFSPLYLQSAIDLLESDFTTNIVFMGVHWFGKNSKAGEKHYFRAMDKVINISKPKLIENKYYLFDKKLIEALLETIPMAFQRPVARRSYFNLIGNYDKESLLWDCDWALRAALMGKCLLINKGLYYQRADNQGYSSVNKELEQMYSNVNFKEKLLKSKYVCNNNKLKRVFKKNIAEILFHIAYNLRKEKKIKSLSVWYKSQTYQLNIKRLPFIFKLLWY